LFYIAASRLYQQDFFLISIDIILTQKSFVLRTMEQVIEERQRFREGKGYGILCASGTLLLAYSSFSLYFET
jgi:hypothetical protein